MYLISVISLSIVMGCCLCGIFSNSFHDNLAQRLGMVGIFLFSLPRWIQLLQTQELTSVCMPADAQVLGHVGLALYCVGTTFKVLKHRPRRRVHAGTQ